MVLKKSDPYSSRLVMCGDLRRGMDASEYKCYMLFIKYISGEDGDSDNFAPTVNIPEDASFKDMLALQVKPSGGA